MSESPDRPRAFDRIEGAIRHRFFRHGPVAAHIALTSGQTPRIVVAFPAGNRGISLSGNSHEPQYPPLACASVGGSEAQATTSNGATPRLREGGARPSFTANAPPTLPLLTHPKTSPVAHEREMESPAAHEREGEGARSAGLALGVALNFAGPVVALDLETDGIRGVLVPITADASEVRFTRAVLGNIRTIRDAGHGVMPTARLSRYAIVVTGPAHDRALAIERADLDRTHVHAIGIEPRDGSDVAVDVNGTIILKAGPDGTVRIDLIATCDATPLAPIPTAHLLRDRAVSNGGEVPATAGTARDFEALNYLSYREKLLAGSWQYLTYFGRDTLLALRLLAPVASADLFEAGLGAVLDRLAPNGVVAHEEALGEYALLDRERRRRRMRKATSDDRDAPVRDWGTGRAAPVLDDKMVDDDFLLAPVLATYLLDVATPGRAAAFLAKNSGARLEAVRANLRFVADRARPYAASGAPEDLIHLRAGIPVGTWRDSADGLGGGRVPYDVNVALVPAALEAAARLWASDLVGPDQLRATEAQALASAWTDSARHFIVAIDGATARERLDAFVAARKLPGLASIRDAIGDVIHFPAIALDSHLKPIPVMHSDDSLVMLFSNPSSTELDEMAQRLIVLFPVGLRVPNVGTLVANPAFAPTTVQAMFTASHYHGTVAWSWQHAAYAAGLARQLARTDVPAPTRANLRGAEAALWEGINATEALRGTEFWTFTVRDGGYGAVPAQGAETVNESNPVQLWSTVWLGIERPRQDDRSEQAPSRG